MFTYAESIIMFNLKFFIEHNYFFVVPINSLNSKLLLSYSKQLVIFLFYNRTLCKFFLVFSF